MPDALVAPSARDYTRTYMLAQLDLRDIDAPWSTEVPKTRPERFFTIEELNSATEYGIFADSQLIQIRGYDLDGQRLANTMRLIKGLWLVMPNELIVQAVEIAGGPTRQKDPDIPMERFLLTGWVTVMTEIA